MTTIHAYTPVTLGDGLCPYLNVRPTPGRADLITVTVRSQGPTAPTAEIQIPLDEARKLGLALVAATEPTEG